MYGTQEEEEEEGVAMASTFRQKGVMMMTLAHIERFADIFAHPWRGLFI